MCPLGGMESMGKPWTAGTEGRLVLRLGLSVAGLPSAHFCASQMEPRLWAGLTGVTEWVAGV